MEDILNSTDEETAFVEEINLWSSLRMRKKHLAWRLLVNFLRPSAQRRLSLDYCYMGERTATFWPTSSLVKENVLREYPPGMTYMLEILNYQIEKQVILLIWKHNEVHLYFSLHLFVAPHLIYWALQVQWPLQNRKETAMKTNSHDTYPIQKTKEVTWYRNGAATFSRYGNDWYLSFIS